MEEVQHRPEEAANKALDSSLLCFYTKCPHCLTSKTCSPMEHRTTRSLHAQEYVAEQERVWKGQNSQEGLRELSQQTIGAGSRLLKELQAQSLLCPFRSEALLRDCLSKDKQ